MRYFSSTQAQKLQVVNHGSTKEENLENSIQKAESPDHAFERSDDDRMQQLRKQGATP
jgi:hypothetical protein